MDKTSGRLDGQNQLTRAGTFGVAARGELAKLRARGELVTSVRDVEIVRLVTADPDLESELELVASFDDEA